MGGPPWALAFLTALAVTLAGTPLLRSLAHSTNFVDKPAERKSHIRPIPYLGGVGLIAGLLAGLVFAPSLSPPIKVIALGGPFIGALGLLDDHRTLNPYLRFAVELSVAALALAAGLRIHATDVAVIDGFFTLVWIVGITNAVNFLDNMDGLSAGVAAAGGLGILALAILGEQVAAATVAAGLVGGCLGFLVYNRRPASIFMGDTGSLFLGFVLAIMAIEVSPALAPPAGFAVPIILLALPVLDTSTVVLARMRRGRSVLEGGKDHLSHRLHKLGLSPGAAVAVLIAIEVTVAGLAVLAGRRVIPLTTAVGATAAVLGALTIVTCRTRVYEAEVTGLPRRVTVAALAGAGLVTVMAVPTLVALMRSVGPAEKGARAVEQGLASLSAGDEAGATAEFTRADGDFRRAEGLLKGRMTSLSVALPIVRSNLAAARTMVDTGRTVAREASRVGTVAQAASVRLGAGSDPAGEARRLAPDLSASASILGDLARDLANANRPYLWPSVKTHLRALRDGLSRQSAAARDSAEVARAVPGLLGAEGQRRYFVALQDNSELRGTGGVFRAWAEVVADGGRLRLVRTGSMEDLNQARPDGLPLDAPDGFLDRYRDFDVADTWQNVNVSPDFRVTAQVINSLYPQSGGQALDGVVAVDLKGFAAILGLTGPLRGDGRAEPVTEHNLAAVVAGESAARLPVATDRQAFLASLLGTSVQAFAQADLGTPRSLAAELRDLVAGGHVALYSRVGAAQELFERIGAAGAVEATEGDSLLVVNQNLTATGIDSFLQREIRYDMQLDPGRQPATITGRVGVTLRNEAPAAGTSVGGDNRTYLSVYSPLALDGAPSGVRVDRELERWCYSTILNIGAQQSRTLELSLRGRVEVRGGWYTLDLPRQASTTADGTHVSVTVPGGWRIVEARGMRIEGSRRAVADVRIDGHRELGVRLQRTAWSRLWYQPKA